MFKPRTTVQTVERRHRPAFAAGNVCALRKIGRSSDSHRLLSEDPTS